MPNIEEVCHACGITANYLTCLEMYGKPPTKACFSISTFHKGVCDVCNHEGAVTETRDFFNPNFELLLEQINKYAKP